MRVVTATPAGRRKYLEILAAHLLRHRHVIDEHQWWVNTREPGDVAYILSLVDEYPDFFRAVFKPLDPELNIGYRIWQYLRECTADETIYIRLDDDICYIDDGAIEALCRTRQENPEPFLVLGNIVNNAICTHFYQRAGLVPESHGIAGYECMDDVGWHSGQFCRWLHRQFLADAERGEVDRWKQVKFDYDGIRRFSINAICWRGEDLAAVPEINDDQVEEEPFLTSELPRRLGRPNVICPQALFAHHAYWPQRKYLDATSADLMARYWRLALSADEEPSLSQSAYERMRWAVAESAWGVRTAIRHSRKLVKNRLRPAREVA